MIDEKFENKNILRGGTVVAVVGDARSVTKDGEMGIAEMRIDVE